MSRLMSVSHTADAVEDRSKDMTRRLGWRFVKPGDRLTLCRKVMGRGHRCDTCKGTGSFDLTPADLPDGDFRERLIDDPEAFAAIERLAAENGWTVDMLVAGWILKQALSLIDEDAL